MICDWSKPKAHMKFSSAIWDTWSLTDFQACIESELLGHGRLITPKLEHWKHHKELFSWKQNRAWSKKSFGKMCQASKEAIVIETKDMRY